MEAGNNTELLTYLNPSQWLSYAVKAKKEIHILGRGTGKTQGIQAPNLKAKLELMPRATCALLGASYMQLFTRILPGVIEGFRSLGWIEGRDYWVGQFAPKSFKIDRPFKAPIKTDYIIPGMDPRYVYLVKIDLVCPMVLILYPSMAMKPSLSIRNNSTMS